MYVIIFKQMLTVASAQLAFQFIQPDIPWVHCLNAADSGDIQLSDKKNHHQKCWISMSQNFPVLHSMYEVHIIHQQLDDFIAYKYN